MEPEETVAIDRAVDTGSIFQQIAPVLTPSVSYLPSNQPTITMTEAKAEILPVRHEATMTIANATAEILPDSAPRMTTATTDQPTITMTEAKAKILPVGHGITNDDSDEDVDFSEERQILRDREKLLMLSSDAAAEAGGDGDHSVVADSNNYNPNPDPFENSEMIDEGVNEKEAEGGDNSIVTSDNSYNPIDRRIVLKHGINVPSAKIKRLLDCCRRMTHWCPCFMRHALARNAPTGIGSRRLYVTNTQLKHVGGPFSNAQKGLLRRSLQIAKNTLNYAR